MAEPLISIAGVSRVYHDGTRDIRVLDDASLAVQAGEIVALVAPSGAGKSTLLHLAGLLERGQGGEINLLGAATGTLSDRRRTALRRRHIGYVYQFHNLLPEFSAEENVALPQMIAGASRTAALARSAELLALLGLADRAGHRPSMMSGGEQQRVAIARALANDPKLILADEPTGNLDPETSTSVFEAMGRMIREQGAAAIVATHNHGLARKADRIVTLDAGRIVPLSLD